MIARESFQSARRALGQVAPGLRLFLVTRGQFTMVDLIFEILRQTTGPARISLWAWSVTGGDGEPQELLRQLCAQPRITDGMMILDGGPVGAEDSEKWTEATATWRARFGEASVKNVNHHAKIMTIEVGGLKILITGSQNLLKTPRIENIDVSEGCDGFEMVREAEQAAPHRRPANVRNKDGLSRSPMTDARVARWRETAQLASLAVGKVYPGKQKLLLTWGEWSMIDAVTAVLRQTGPARVTVWTWVIAEFEVARLVKLREGGHITSGQINIHAEGRGSSIQQDVAARIEEFQAGFGADSVRYVGNHSKMATVSNGKWRVLLRGSLNWNCCKKCENLLLTEGGPDFELVERIERGLPVLADDCTTAQAYRASGLSDKLLVTETPAFRGLSKFEPVLTRWAR